MDDRAQRAANARAILNHPLVTEILDGLERAAIDACLTADPRDDEARAAWAAEARAVRTFRSRLMGVVDDGEPRKPVGSIA